MKKVEKQMIELNVNGEVYRLLVGEGPGEVSASDSLAHTLRENLSLTGTKISCDKGACGACTVIMDGDAVASCSILTVECEGKKIITIEGLADKETGALDPIQQAILDETAFQCGFCTPGAIMTARAFLDKNPHPTREELGEALSGVFCRCGTHHMVIDAVMGLVEKEA